MSPFCFDNEDSFEDDIDDCILAELAVLKSSQYLFCGSYRQWVSNWEQTLRDGMYMADDEFLIVCHAIEQAGRGRSSLQECLWKCRQAIINASYHGIAKVLR